MCVEFAKYANYKQRAIRPRSHPRTEARFPEDDDADDLRNAIFATLRFTLFLTLFFSCLAVDRSQHPESRLQPESTSQSPVSRPRTSRHRSHIFFFGYRVIGPPVVRSFAPAPFSLSNRFWQIGVRPGRILSSGPSRRCRPRLDHLGSHHLKGVPSNSAHSHIRVFHQPIDRLPFRFDAPPH